MAEASFRTREHQALLQREDLAAVCPFGAPRPAVTAALDDLRAIQASFRRSKSPAKRYRQAILFSKAILRVHDALEARLSLEEYLLARLGPSVSRLRRSGLSWEEARALRRDWEAWNLQYGRAWRLRHGCPLRSERGGDEDIDDDAAVPGPPGLLETARSPV